MSISKAMGVGQHTFKNSVDSGYDLFGPRSHLNSHQAQPDSLLKGEVEEEVERDGEERKMKFPVLGGGEPFSNLFRPRSADGPRLSRMRSLAPARWQACLLQGASCLAVWVAGCMPTRKGTPQGYGGSDDGTSGIIGLTLPTPPHSLDGGVMRAGVATTTLGMRIPIGSLQVPFHWRALAGLYGSEWLLTASLTTTEPPLATAVITGLFTRGSTYFTRGSITSTNHF